MAKLVWNPGAVLAPVPPTLVTCGSLQEPKVLTIAWTGIINTRPPKTYIAVRPQRHSYPILKKQREFVINMPSADLVRAVDYCGVRSGATVDKFAETGLTPQTSAVVSAPSLAQCPLCLECRVTDIIPMGSHDLFLADIVKVTVEESCVDAQGKLHIDRCNLLAYAHGSYFSLGEELGTFGYSVRKKPLASAPAGKGKGRAAPKSEKEAKGRTPLGAGPSAPSAGKRKAGTLSPNAGKPPAKNRKRDKR